MAFTIFLYHSLSHDHFTSPLQHDAQMDYYGKRLATCSSDRTIKIFEVVHNTQNLIATLVG